MNPLLKKYAHDSRGHLRNLRNLECLSEIIDLLQDYRNKSDEFWDLENRESHKEALIALIMKCCTDKTITYSINKTQFPDEVIIRFLQEHEIVTSINQLEIVTAEWYEDAPNRRFGIIIKSKSSAGEVLNMEIELSKSKKKEEEHDGESEICFR